MKITFTTFIIFLSLFIAKATLAEQSPLKCEIGPVRKVYGNTNWLVYSCTDKKTVVVVSDKGSPAMPFYFTFYRKDGGYSLHGEGTGDKKATNAAYIDLTKLTVSEIKKLIQETRNGK